MSESFTLRDPLHTRPSQTRDLRVLVTGAAGNIGSFFARNAKPHHKLRLLCLDSDDVAPLQELGEVVRGDITNAADCRRICDGCDVVLHLAADPSPSADWSSLLPNNIVGTYNIFAAAKATGVRRVVFASSIHAVGGYVSDRQVAPNDPVNPGDLYGVTKCFGEALARYAAEQEGVQCIAVRIGAFQPIRKADDASAAVSLLDSFVSRRDLNQLLQKAVDAEHLQFAIVHGLSDARFKKLDISTARELLGYEPEDDLTEMNDELAKLHLHSDVIDHTSTGGLDDA
jgi:nucleoside-diphosphate-sugar epimerase